MAAGSTPATEALARAGIGFGLHRFDHEPSAQGYGLAAAAAIGADPDRVFKTLVILADGDPAVAVVPVSCQLALRQVAGALGAKRAEMCPVEHAERITGYVAGGISPFGQRRRLPTVIDETCVLWDTVFVSGGRRGLDLEVAPDDLVGLLQATVAAIAAP